MYHHAIPAIHLFSKFSSLEYITHFHLNTFAKCQSLRYILKKTQSRTNGPINAHLTIAQVMPRYNHNNEKQEALL